MPAVTTVAIHQPNFAPWLGFFHKMMVADVFVLLDDVEFSKNSYTNRVKVAGGRWLTVPVTRRNDTLINDVMIADHRFPSRHLGQLRAEYPKSQQMVELIELESQHAGGRLIDLNVALLQRLRKAFSIATPIVFASDLDAPGSATERLVNIVEAVGSRTYLSGEGGFGYQDLDQFGNRGIEVVRSGFSHPVYPQVTDEFIAGLSALDVWLLHGDDAVQFLGVSSN